MSASSVAVIADVIRSRSFSDRSSLQKEVEELLQAVQAAFPAVRSFSPTVGDELQAVYATRNQALAATLYAGLLQGEGPQLRFGLGEGTTYPVDSSASQSVEDGPGWWRARQAIEELEEIQSRSPQLRSRFISAVPAEDAVVNAYLLARDHICAGFTERTRSYAVGVLEGRSQKEIAAEIGVSQSAVSQSLRGSGAASLIAGLKELTSAAEQEPA
ncbi:SatD family protein [Nesterenkonia ebinurensis]|uniref:SatD family protein n=1 Tax=Nesterenkonia ebinurensis TaxID=2608252 RepID=UPI00123E0446|nr:SatD family protein [Nesterenkonia ebinurensis]